MINMNNNSNPYDLFRLKELKNCAKDPVYFINNYMRITNPIRGEMFLNLRDKQKDLIETFADPFFTIASLPRQFGKSTCAAAFLLWKAIFTPDSAILVGSHSQSCAFEILKRIKYAYDELPDFLRVGIIRYNKGTIEFDNGSRIMTRSITATAGRGLALSLLYLDEFAIVNANVAQQFWDSIMPCIAMGGDCIIASSVEAMGAGHPFIQLWKDANKIQPNGLGINDFKAFSIYED